MGSQHLNDPTNWERGFDRTREAYGHNRAGKAGAKCMYCYHRIIAFNPPECDLNGGRLTAGDCMGFAREAGLARSPRFETDLDHVRRVVRESVREVARGDDRNKMRALSVELDCRGVHMGMSRDKSSKRANVVFEYRPTYDRRDASGRRVRAARISGHKLGRGFNMSGVSRGLGGMVAREIKRAAAREVHRTFDEAMGEDR